MRNTSMIALVVLFSSLTIALGQEADGDESCSSKTLEECTKHLLRYSTEDVKVPETVEEVKENCA